MAPTKHFPVRRHPRVPIAMPVEVERGGEFVTGSTRNISQGGMFVEMTDPLESGAYTRVRMRIDDGSAPIEVEGEVVWVADLARPTFGFPQQADEAPADPAPKGMGVRFKAMQEDCRESLASFVRDLQDLLRIMAIAEKSQV